MIVSGERDTHPQAFTAGAPGTQGTWTPGCRRFPAINTNTGHVPGSSAFFQVQAQWRYFKYCKEKTRVCGMTFEPPPMYGCHRPTTTSYGLSVVHSSRFRQSWAPRPQQPQLVLPWKPQGLPVLAEQQGHDSDEAKAQRGGLAYAVVCRMRHSLALVHHGCNTSTTMCPRAAPWGHQSNIHSASHSCAQPHAHTVAVTLAPSIVCPHSKAKVVLVLALNASKYSSFKKK